MTFKQRRQLSRAVELFSLVLDTIASLILKITIAIIVIGLLTIFILFAIKIHGISGNIVFWFIGVILAIIWAIIRDARR